MTKSSKTASKSGLISTGEVARNRRAHFDYTIRETFEAGIVLMGTEVKSLRHGLCTLTEAYAGRMADSGDVWIYNMYIPEYQSRSAFSHQPRRPRKLLMRRREAQKILGSIARQGCSLVPISLYFNARGLAKVNLGLGVGKKKVDKRQTIKEREWGRQKQRVLRNQD